MLTHSARLPVKLRPTEKSPVNGWKLSEADIVKFYSAEANRYQAKSPLTAPEIGCYISHLKAWERIASGNSTGGFIFEDDFLATTELGSVLADISDDGGSTWDMIKLFSLDNSPHTIARQPLGQQHEIVIPYRVPSCMIGYGVTVAAAAYLYSTNQYLTFNLIAGTLRYYVPAKPNPPQSRVL